MSKCLHEFWKLLLRQYLLVFKVNIRKMSQLHPDFTFSLRRPNVQPSQGHLRTNRGQTNAKEAQLLQRRPETHKQMARTRNC